MVKSIIAICSMVVAGLVAGCGSNSPNAGKTAAHAAASTNTSASCGTLSHQWASAGGGTAGLTALGRDFETLARDTGRIANAFKAGSPPPAAILTKTTDDASQLGAQAQTDLANLPPSCVPGELAPYRNAMAEASQASQDMTASVNAVSAGNDQGAISDLSAFDEATGKASSDMTTATSAIDAYNKA